MTDPYSVLGLTSDVDDATIRKRFLELTIQFPPEQFPERSTRIRKAYELIGTLEKRMRYHLAPTVPEDLLSEMIEASRDVAQRPRPGLRDLIRNTRLSQKSE